MTNKILITGGIGTGKSTVLKMFKDTLPKYQFVDMDSFINSLYTHQTPQFKTFLMDNFGTNVKKEISLIVFSDMLKKDILDSYLFNRVEEFLVNWLDSDEHSIMEFPLFFEMIEKTKIIPNNTKICNQILEKASIITIRANDNIRIDRIIARSKVTHPEWTKETILGILVSQMNSERKEKMSDYVVDNSYSLDYTLQQVRTICVKFGDYEDA